MIPVHQAVSYKVSASTCASFSNVGGCQSVSTVLASTEAESHTVSLQV
jgi:hypothetical protein